MRESPFSSLWDRWAKEFQEEMAKWFREVLEGSITLDNLMSFARSMGVDPSQLVGKVNQHRTPDPYKILGLERSASDEEVKRRYREMLHHLHPDTAGTKGTETLLQLVMTAYEIIKRERRWTQP